VTKIRSITSFAKCLHSIVIDVFKMLLKQGCHVLLQNDKIYRILNLNFKRQFFRLFKTQKPNQV